MTAPLPIDGPSLLDLIHESVFLRDLGGRVIYWNRASQELYGWTAEQAIDQQTHVLLKDPHSDKVIGHERDLMETGRWEGELRRTTRDGRRLTIEASWSLLRDGGREAIAIVETGRDITGKRDRERRYTNLFNAMAASFWELDFTAVGKMVKELQATSAEDLRCRLLQDPGLVRAMVRATRVLDVNDQTVALFGRGNKQELLGTIDAFWPDESLSVFAESVVAAVSGKPNYICETRLCSIEGRMLDALFTACFPANSVANGQIIVGIIDISETKRAFAALEREKQRYHYLFNYMPIALWQVNARQLVDRFKRLSAEGVTSLTDYLDENPGFLGEAMEALQVEEVNERAVELWGASDASELVGPATKYWRDNPGTFRRAMEARFGGRTFFQEETRFRAFDGRWIDALFTAARPGPANDLDLSIVGIVDITDRNRAQEKLRQVQAEFAHASRVSLLGELVASIAHEVNQPLAAISTNGEAGLRWLSRPEPDIKEALKLMQCMVTDARRAADIIARIRGMASHRAPESGPVSLAEVIEESLAFLSHEIKARNVTVVCELVDEAPFVLADHTQLQQVMVNLVLNALQAMSGAGLRRTLTIRTQVQAATKLSCTVEDSGPGIAPEQLEHLFESFATTKNTGMGIGLCICRTIIEAHGGTISADNNAELKGARFRFYLPAMPRGSGCP